MRKVSVLIGICALVAFALTLWAQAPDLSPVMKAAKAGNLDAAKAPAGTINKSCKACHDVHREQLPDKSYKFK